MVPFYIHGDISLILKGKMITITPEHPLYNAIKSKLAMATEEELVELVGLEQEKEFPQFDLD